MTQAPSWPRLAPALAARQHLLLLAGDVPWEEVDALVRSAVLGAEWQPAPGEGLPGQLNLLAADHADLTAAGEPLPLLPDGSTERALLTGPWRVDIVNRGEVGLPDWVESAFVLDVGAERSDPAPDHPGGYGALLDAFGDRHPIGLERQVLDVLLASARRLAGAVRTSSGVVVEPDPAAAVDVTLYSPTWLDPAAAAAVLEPHLPGIEILRGVEDEALARLDGYGAEWSPPRSDSANDDAGGAQVSLTLHVEAAEVIPAPLADAEWTSGGVIIYRLQWQAEPEQREPVSRVGRRRRERARAAVAAAAQALHEAAGGELLDEDEFLLDPTDLT
ncbi:hypothetical protein [Salana multivorans]